MRLSRYGRWVVVVFLGIALLLAGACGGGGAGNTPPQISSLTATPDNIGVGGSSTVVCVATDPDGDTLSYDWTATDGSITWTRNVATWVAPDVEGTYIITVTVDDGGGGMATQYCYITVGVATGSINITSNPEGANVYLDGEDTGKVTPCSITGLTEGGYTIKLTYYHYKDEVGTEMVNTGLVSYIDWTLEYAHEDTQTIQPGFTAGNDAYVYEETPADNYWPEQYLFVGAKIMKKFYRSYLQFELSTIPSTAVITNAEVGLFYEDTSGAISTIVGVHKVISSWDEDAVDWAHQPTWTATPESTVEVPAAVTQDFVFWDITDLVQGWVEGSIDNKGVLLKDTDESTVKAWKRFYSANEDLHIKWHPKLVITYFDLAP